MVAVRVGSSTRHISSSCQSGDYVCVSNSCLIDSSAARLCLVADDLVLINHLERLLPVLAQQHAKLCQLLDRHCTRNETAT